MSKPVQLIIEGVALPTTTRNRYSCYPEKLKQRVDMISGRGTEEVRGEVQIINYSYGYMGEEKGREVLAVLRKRGTLSVAYLPDDGDELVTSTFLVENLTNPTLLYFRGGVAKWNNIAFTLREVKPHA